VFKAGTVEFVWRREKPIWRRLLLLGLILMVWLPALLSTICLMVAAGRAHSQHLDALEAEWLSEGDAGAFFR
jgi:type VI protein secretion system component VasK